MWFLVVLSFAQMAFGSARSAWYTDPEINADEVRASCELPRLHQKDFVNAKGLPDGAKFLKELEALKKPVIIEGLIDHWIALKKWQDKSYFLKKYGVLKVPQGSLHDSATNNLVERGEGVQKQEIMEALEQLELIEGKADPMTLREFAHGFHMDAAKPKFLFETARPDKSLLFRLGRDLRNETGRHGLTSTPTLLHSLHCKMRVFSMGATLQGLLFHVHSTAWLGSIVGHKRWYFLPPPFMKQRRYEILDNLIGSPPHTWKPHELGGMQNVHNMLQCVQRPGEVVYIPKNWFHATTNLEDCISFGAQAEDSANKEGRQPAQEMKRPEL